jgi:hypothetical protein
MDALLLAVDPGSRIEVHPATNGENGPIGMPPISMNCSQRSSGA